jgi:hypothetical protein
METWLPDSERGKRVWGRLRHVCLVAAVLAITLTLVFSARSGEAQSSKLSTRSSPPDTTPYARAAVPEDMTVGKVGAEKAPSGSARTTTRRPKLKAASQVRPLENHAITRRRAKTCGRVQ